MFDPTKLNYEAFTQKNFAKTDFTPVQLANAQYSTVPPKGAKAAIIVVAVILGIFFVFPVLLAAIVPTQTQSDSGSDLGITIFTTIFSMLIVLGIIGLIAWAVWHSLFGEKIATLRLLKFALDNDFGFLAQVSHPPIGPIMFSVGHNQATTCVVTVGDELTFAKYQFITGSGKYQQVHNTIFARWKLPRAVPQLYLRAKGNWVYDDIGEYKVQKLQLEGDFDNYFTVYAPPNYQDDALDLLTPDVMQALQTYGAAYDFELLGNYLYVYAAAGTMDQADRLQKFLVGLSQIAAEFDVQVETYMDDHVAANVANTDAGQIAPTGNFARKRITAGAVISIILMVVYFTIMILGHGGY